MTLVTQRIPVPGEDDDLEPRLSNAYYSIMGQQFGTWNAIERMADENPNKLFDALGIDRGPTVLFSYSLTNAMLGMHRALTIDIPLPVSKLELLFALQPVQHEGKQKVILSQNGSTIAADSVVVEPELAYRGAEFIYVGALRPCGEIVSIPGNVRSGIGSFKRNDLETALRTGVGLPLSSFPYARSEPDEYDIIRQRLSHP